MATGSKRSFKVQISPKGPNPKLKNYPQIWFSITHWKEAKREEFVAAWEKEIASIPEFATSTFHLITGLLLRIWRRLPESNARVYRLQTDDGERVIGRMLTPIEVEAFCRNIGMEAPKLAAGDAWHLFGSLRASFTQLSFTIFQNLRRPASQFISRSNITDGTVQAMLVILLHVGQYQPPCLINVNGVFGPSSAEDACISAPVYRCSAGSTAKFTHDPCP